MLLWTVWLMDGFVLCGEIITVTFRMKFNDICVFVFKQKTAYEMRISDWSSDVCSSDLIMQITTKNHLDKRSNRPVATIGASSRVSSDTRRPHGLSRLELQRIVAEMLG